MSHLRSFKKFLFDAIKIEDFTDEDGTIYRMTYDQAIMLPVAEQVPPDRRRFYDKILYIYNRENPINDDKVNRAEQKRMDLRIRQQKPYELHPRYRKEVPVQENPKHQPLTNSAIIVIPSYNVEKWTRKCALSVLEQTYPDLGIVFVDDNSNDQTYHLAKKLIGDRPNSRVMSNPERKLAMANLVFAIRDCCSNPESVIFILDGDDWLSCPTAIAEMMEQHKTADVVWSKYESTDRGECISAEYTTEEVRRQPWVASPLRSFKKFLFDAIYDEDFRDSDGEYYRYLYDQAIMLPILEQVPLSRRRFYNKVLYVYNRENPLNDDKVSAISERMRIRNLIQIHPPYGLHARYRENTKPASLPITPSLETVSVLVSSYNQLDQLKLFMESMYRQNILPLEVIVADDGSTDGTVGWLDSLDKWKYPFPVRYVTREHDGYRLASLQNMGAKEAKGTRLLFTNADVLHCPASIAGHASFREDILGVGIIQGISVEGAALVTIGAILDFQQIIALEVKYCGNRTNTACGFYDLNTNQGAVWGGNFSVPTAIFVQVGGFDEGYVGWGGEDTNIASRCQIAGYRLDWVRDSIGFHLGHELKDYHYKYLDGP